MDQEWADPEGAELAALSDADLFGLRLAGQVLGHKAALVGRPRVARWFAELETVMGAELARRGVGVLLASEPDLVLPADADAEDYSVLAEYLSLLAANAALSDAQRQTCRRLLERVVN
ncbi:MAG TPA: hypothetical protein VM305_02565 [Candidatus Limnocylindrales bacterium]|nr:hypothetical protein [Candidatus Limnocylindrales bacterium]